MQGHLLDHDAPVMAGPRQDRTAHGFGPTNRSGVSCSRMESHRTDRHPGGGTGPVRISLLRAYELIGWGA